VQTTNLSLSLAKNFLPVAPVVDNPSVFPLPGSGNVTLDIYNVTTRVSTDASFYCLDVATAYAVAKTHLLPEMYYYQVSIPPHAETSNAE